MIVSRIAYINTPGSIGCQLDIFLWSVGIDGLNEPNGADGDQVLLVRHLGIVLLHNMGNQAEVALDQDIPGRQVAFGGQF